MTMTMRLYSSPTSPFARKALILIHWLNGAARFDLNPTRLSPIVGKAPDTLALAPLNPLAKLPVLVLPDDDNAVLNDSLVICEYIDHTLNNNATGASPHRFFPSAPPRPLAGHDPARPRPRHVRGRVALRLRAQPRMYPAQYRCDEYIRGQWANIQRALEQLEQKTLAGQLKAPADATIREMAVRPWIP
ncbi:glutathione S-transferase [Geranomyces variabilis]|nr:glutathione S-transferase [Geranomyces variabilis]KAJ3131373.1 hypothetical protein HDU90_008309 [Geranomyces variabilis]